MQSGSLEPVMKEMIYITVSMSNSCQYCIKSHILAAKKNDMPDKILKELITIVAMANKTNRLVESYQLKLDNYLK